MESLFPQNWPLYMVVGVTLIILRDLQFLGVSSLLDFFDTNPMLESAHPMIKKIKATDIPK